MVSLVGVVGFGPSAVGMDILRLGETGSGVAIALAVLTDAFFRDSTSFHSGSAAGFPSSSSMSSKSDSVY